MLLSCSFKSAHISEILLAAHRTLVGNEVLDRDDRDGEAEGVGVRRSRKSCFEGDAGQALKEVHAVRRSTEPDDVVRVGLF